jgi:hypothetical protein
MSTIPVFCCVQSTTPSLSVSTCGETLSIKESLTHGLQATALVDAWWRSVPDTFRVVRDAAGVEQGFSTLCQPTDVSRSLLRSDPLTAA